MFQAWRLDARALAASMIIVEQAQKALRFGATPPNLCCGSTASSSRYDAHSRVHTSRRSGRLLATQPSYVVLVSTAIFPEQPLLRTLCHGAGSDRNQCIVSLRCASRDISTACTWSSASTLQCTEPSPDDVYVVSAALFEFGSTRPQ